MQQSAASNTKSASAESQFNDIKIISEVEYSSLDEASPSTSTSYEHMSLSMRAPDLPSQSVLEIEQSTSTPTPNDAATQVFLGGELKDSSSIIDENGQGSNISEILEPNHEIASTIDLQHGESMAAQKNIQSIVSHCAGLFSPKLLLKAVESQLLANRTSFQQNLHVNLPENIFQTPTREIYVGNTSEIKSTPSAPTDSSQRVFTARKSLCGRYVNMERKPNKRFKLRGQSSTRLPCCDQSESEFLGIAADSSTPKEIEKMQVILKPRAKKNRAPKNSPYFESSNKLDEEKDISKLSFSPQRPLFAASSSSYNLPHRYPLHRTRVCIPLPPLSSPCFGLIQERLADNPFRLLIATTFLTRTHGKHAIPVFFMLMKRYPTPESLLDAPKEDIVSMIRHLGFQNQHANTYQNYASIWLNNPPMKDRRYAVRGYPSYFSARNIKKGEVLTDMDEREAWEIGHMTSGPYALDSWRIFCRDKLRGLTDGWNGEGTGEDFQPEWMRVLPEDKELIAFLRWMWLKEGFLWNPLTGDKEVADQSILAAAMNGLLVCDDVGSIRVINELAGGEQDVN